ncbi:hypothetical protein Tco_1490238, partial [Tanacetum coccineum]
MWRRHCSVTVGQPPLDHRSTVVNCGSQHRRTTYQRQRSTTVNGGGPPLTTAGPPVNQRVMAGYWVGQVGSWAESNRHVSAATSA